MLYVVYIAIDGTLATDWVKWMVGVHIPNVLATRCFVTASLVRDAAADDRGRVAYRVLFRSATDDDLERYHREHARSLQAQHSARYAGAFTARREILPVVSQF